MKLYNVIICNIFCILFSYNINYFEFTQSTYKPLDSSSELNFQITFNDAIYPLFGIEWWVSDKLQLSGNISSLDKDDFKLYNNISIGYYNSSINWLYSDSNFLQLELHKLKYTNPSYKWINVSYKSRYNIKNFITGYDLNYSFWKDYEDKFASLIVAYNIRNKILIEFKFDLINSQSNKSLVNLSIPI